MPELPEVENMRRYLVQAGLPGRTITGFRTGWPKSVRKPALEKFVLGLSGRRVEAVHRRAKYLLFPLNTGSVLILHLGMTGGLRLQDRAQPAHPMVHHVFFLDDGRELRFQDGRKFGKLWLVQNASEVLPTLGPEPLGEDFTPQALGQALAGRNAPVKALLLEQSIVAGMGNLYADESLYLAGIHPLRPASGLSDADVSRLRDAIVAALTSAVAQYDRGRAEGWPEPPLGLEAWTISRQPGAPCPRCGSPISGIRVRGRSTYFCPQCQG
jgi:formamidopyrimidine-DNA glycosylase